MTLKTAAEDLAGTTLQSVSGMLAKLEYVGGLLQADGSYQHWGLERTYGRVSAQQALADAHRATLSRVLRTPLRQLLQEIEKFSAPRGLTPGAYLEQLRQNTACLLPPAHSTGSGRHLGSALHALSSLAKTRPHA
jgi:hypothetical protein